MSRTILVTGAIKGIGFSTSQRLAKEGHTVAEESSFITGQTLFVDGGGSIGQTL